MTKRSITPKSPPSFARHPWSIPGISRERVRINGRPAADSRHMTDTPFDIPSISTLVAFEATARLGAMNRAAVELNTSQSAISRYIRVLEMSLEVKLFQRIGRGVELTKEGEAYHATVQSTLECLHAAGCSLRTQGKY